MQLQGPGGGRRQGMLGGRCRLCRSRAKYVSGHRSFDTAATSNSRVSSFFDGGYRGMRQTRRAISEDRRSDGHTTEGKHKNTLNIVV